MSTDRKYQVFVSSTYTDLPESRQELVQSLLAMGMIPTGMELYPTEQNNQWPMIQKVISECDYYIVMVGGRYGTLSPMGLSYTHREYIYAATKKKPVLALLHENPDSLPVHLREKAPEDQVRLRDFRELLRQKALFRYWSTPGDLQTVLKKAMPAMIKQHPSPGWVRAGQVADLTSQREVQELRRRIAELEHEKEELSAGHRPPAETLARGTDPVEMQYNCNVYVKGDCKATRSAASMTWNQVFACMAPQMLEEVPESVMRQALEEHISTNALRDVQKQLPKAHAVRNVVVDGGSFNQAKIQLRALGLIRKCPRRDPGGELFWQLTPQGDRLMTEVLSRRRG